jgi:CBS domain-containing protein
MKVHELMSAELITITPEQDLGIALALMHEFGIRRLPVLEGDTTTLIGLITIRDIRAAINAPFLREDDAKVIERLESIPVREIMSTELIFIAPNATVGDAAREMVSHKVDGLPVVDLDASGNATLVGLITAHDLLQHLADLEGHPQMEG